MCGSNHVVKNGKTGYGKQLYKCGRCGVQSVKKYKRTKWQNKLFTEYVFGKQTLNQLAVKYKRSAKTIRKHLDQHGGDQSRYLPSQPIVIGMDCSFFGRGYGIILVRCPQQRKNLYWKEISTENKEAYEEARSYLEQAGINIQAVVIDAKHGIKQVFSDLVVQICQYHQKQIVRRYLTNRPKTAAGQELKEITGSLANFDELSFERLLHLWHDRWQDFLKERTLSGSGKMWRYTHGKIRAAYRSLKMNLPHLYSYKKYPQLHIPNTNNSLEGYFSKLKKQLNNHNGLRRNRRYKIIESILNSS